jgi:hypothetical protein
VGTYSCQISNACGPSVTAGALVTVPFGRATINPDPASVTTCSGTSATLTAGIIVAALSTQPDVSWTRDGVTVTDGLTASGSVISGAATGTLAIDNLQPADAGSYVCIASNACGATTSLPATVSVSARCSVADLPLGGCADGTVDGSDFIAFINSFAIGDPTVDPAADISGGGPNADQPDGTIDGTDFIDFINAFAIGC